MELRDFRGKISVETDLVLTAYAHATGRDKAELVREILHDYALGEMRKHTVLANLSRGEGRETVAGGTTGTPR